jgi:hypothetical protein
MRAPPAPATRNPARWHGRGSIACESLPAQLADLSPDIRDLVGKAVNAGTVRLLLDASGVAPRGEGAAMSGAPSGIAEP